MSLEGLFSEFYSISMFQEVFFWVDDFFFGGGGREYIFVV